MVLALDVEYSLLLKAKPVTKLRRLLQFAIDRWNVGFGFAVALAWDEVTGNFSGTSRPDNAPLPRQPLHPYALHVAMPALPRSERIGALPATSAPGSIRRRKGFRTE